MKITKNPYIRVLLALLLAIAVMMLSGISAEFLSKFISGNTESDKLISSFLLQTMFLVFSVLFAFLFTKGKMSDYGFKISKGIPFIKIFLTVFIVELIITAIFLFIPMEGEGHFADDFTFWQIVALVWIWASTCEEVFTRGLILGFLQPVNNYGIKIRNIHFSLPVIVSAFIFMLMHVPLLFMGIDTVLGIQILISTFALGIIAGFYREQTGSLVPAIFAHMMANILGMGIGYLTELIT